MATLPLTDDQVISLVQQLPPAQKRLVLTTLAAAAGHRRAERMTQAETQLRAHAATRGLDWDAMDDDARELFIDDLLRDGAVQ
jgi:hypothetical protein